MRNSILNLQRVMLKSIGIFKLHFKEYYKSRKLDTYIKKFIEEVLN